MEIWFIIAVTLFIIELSTINLVSIWFALGAAVAGVSAIFIDNISIQIAIFIATSILTLLLTKPVVKKIRQRPITKTNLDSVVGKTGLVTEDISKYEYGEVKVDGKKWTAMSDKKILKNSKVEILAIDGVKLKVREIKEEN